MIKVMIVEDEPPILRDIKKCIESVNSDFKVVSTASNGSQAMMFLKDNIPDVIFTDIQMPVVDGLELIKQIRECKLDIQIVILSGYSDFSYAKTAMSLGVTHYLLKPVNIDELSILLNNLSALITQKRHSMERKYISKLLENEPVPDSKTEGYISIEQYSIMLFCAGSFPTYTMDYYSPKKDFWKNNDIEKLAADILASGESVWVFEGATCAEKVVVLTLSTGHTERLHSIAASIQPKLVNGSFPVTVVISKMIDKVHAIGHELQNIRTVLKKNIVIGLSQIINTSSKTYQQNSLVGTIPQIDPTIATQLEMYARQDEISALKEEIQKLFKVWESERYTQLWVEKLLHDLVSIYIKSLNGIECVNPAELETEIHEAISISNSYKELFDNIFYIFEDLLDKKNENQPEQAGMEALMLKIDKYIQANYTECINNQKLSGIFWLGPSYLSKLFREYKGLSPTDYLVKLRIDKAKKLIENRPDFFSKDIATAVGYSDPLYFSKIFKKETGKSPTEYRNSILNKPD